MGIAITILSAAPAGAQTSEVKAAARAAAEAGGDAFDAGKWGEAADLFERAERLMHAPPHVLFAARAHAKLGHLVQARELYLSLTREELGGRASKVFKDAQQMGTRELADIEARLPHVSVVVQGAGPLPVRVTRNGEVMATELLGVPVPTNPGDYSFQALAEGKESAVTSIKVKEGARETVMLTLGSIPGWKPSSESAGGGRPKENVTTQTTSGGLRTDDAPSPEQPSSGRPYLIGSIASFAVGAAGIGLGAWFFDKRSTSAARGDDLYAKCQKAECVSDSPLGQEVASADAQRNQETAVSIVGFAVGGLGLAGGVTLLILDAKRDNKASTAITPVVGTNYVGLRGRF
jgi:hypothetical protein